VTQDVLNSTSKFTGNLNPAELIAAGHGRPFSRRGLHGSEKIDPVLKLGGHDLLCVLRMLCEKRTFGSGLSGLHHMREGESYGYQKPGNTGSRTATHLRSGRISL
jgi:hypothetical protein